MVPQTRRTFLSRTGLGLGSIALTSIRADAGPMAAKAPPRPATAKAVIYLHMSGGPPSLDLFDVKPRLTELHGRPCPDEVLKGERFAFIKGRPTMLGSPYEFRQVGESGAWVSELLPHTAGVADELCFIKSMTTDQINHAPAELLTFTGSPRPGSASFGSWACYGLGSECQDLPGFVVLLSGGTDPSGGKAVWSSGFLPSVYQGVQCRSSGPPILYSDDPPGLSRELRRRSLDALKSLNEREAELAGDPETRTRIEQYELAFRMQASVPEAFDIGREPEAVRSEYGAKPGQAVFANNCLLARRLVERGVRFVQLFDWGWDVHGTNPGDDIIKQLPAKCRDVDRPCAALVRDLKRRGLLDSTLIVWGGEFGRTPMNEARGGSKYLGRDHHPHCYTMWLAGGGIKPGMTFGATDDFGYRVAEKPVTVKDLHCTLLHVLGFDAHQFGYRYQGLNQRLIGPGEEGEVIRAVLA